MFNNYFKKYLEKLHKKVNYLKNKLEGPLFVKGILKAVTLDILPYSYLEKKKPELIAYLRDYFKKARYNPTIEKIKWEEGTNVFVYIASDIHTLLAKHNFYEKNEITFLKKLLKEGDTFVDIGANIGLYTVLASKLVGGKGRVLAFELSSREYDLLIKNIKINNLKNITALKIAIADYNGIADLHIGGGRGTGINTLANKLYTDQIPEENIEKVNVFTLDHILPRQGISKVDGIKIDVEGYEVPVLKGMEKTMQDFQPFLMVEISDLNLKNANFNKEDIFNIVKNYGYDIFYYAENGDLTAETPPYTLDSEILYYDIVCIHKSKHYNYNKKT